jgi:plastocyanin domain-containing protein
MRIIRASAIVLILLLGSVGFGQEAAKQPFVAVLGADGIQRAEITGGSYYFDPSDIVVKVNVPVELKVKKSGGSTPHDIALKAPEAGIDFSVSLGTEPKTVKFTPTKVGKYPFWCTKHLPFSKSHKEKGMEGVIEVVE